MPARAKNYDPIKAKAAVLEGYHDHGHEYVMERVPGITKKQVQRIAMKYGVRLSKEARSKALQRKRSETLRIIDFRLSTVYRNEGGEACARVLLEEHGIKMTKTALQSRASKFGIKMTDEAYAARRAEIHYNGAGSSKAVKSPDELDDLERLALCGGHRKKEVRQPLMEDKPIWRNTTNNRGA